MTAETEQIAEERRRWRQKRRKRESVSAVILCFKAAEREPNISVCFRIGHLYRSFKPLFLNRQSSDPSALSDGVPNPVMDLPTESPAGRRGGRAPGEEEEEEEEHHQNPFLSTSISKPSPSKLQFRKEISRARWDEAMGMGEVIEKKGSLWTTTGVIRNGKLYCHIEEILFLAERGALLLLDVDDTGLSIKDIYKKIAEGKYGCSWESFEAYKHLKLLGYIVGRHGLPWSMKNKMICCNNNLLQSTSDIDGRSDGEVGESIPIIRLLKDMQINDVTPTFDVYLPNSKFRKSSPGDPCFLLCLVRGKPPSRLEVENLEKMCNGIPLKFCHVDHGRVSFFSFHKVTIPSLP